MADKFVRASRLFNRFLKLTLGHYMMRLFGYKVYNDHIDKLKPPYIVLANHTNNWDPFLLSMCFPEPVYFVTSDTHFRSAFFRFLFRLVGSIPKTKFVSDPGTTRSIFNIVKHGGIIGIFPEGRRSWDGKTLPILYPTAKLIKSLGIPVVGVVFKGACLSMPRWAKNTRKGQLTMHCSLLLDGDKISSLNTDEIFGIITDGLAHDEYEWQKEVMISFKGKNLAEGLELFLFCCPNCKSIGKMKSSNSEFRCLDCDYSVEYDTYGFLNTKHSKHYYKNTRDWNIWQLAYFEAYITSMDNNAVDNPIFDDTDVLAVSGTRLTPLKEIQSGRLACYYDRITFSGGNDVFLEFPIKKIYGENIQSNKKFEFYFEKILYRFTGNTCGLSAYKWVKAVEILKKLHKQEAVKKYE